MPLCEPIQITEFGRQTGERTFAHFAGIRLPARYFRTAREGPADVLFQRLEDGTGYILLVSADVAYQGPDPEMRRMFTQRAERGWRPMAILRPAEPDAVLRQADLLLGLRGRAPQAHPPSEPREIVVPHAEVAEAGDANRKGSDDSERFGIDLVEEARRSRLQMPLYRDDEIAAAVRILSKEGKNAVCLVGEPGVGKSKIVEGLAVLIAEDRVPPSLRGVRLLEVNLAFVAAGATYQNEFEGRMKKILDRARDNSRIVLFLDELHTLRTLNNNVAQMVKNDLGRGRVKVIGATTNAEFRLIESDAALARRFQVVPVKELNRGQTIDILGAKIANLQRHHGVSISSELLSVVVDLSIRYVPSRHLPDKALDLLDEACACARLAIESQSERLRRQT